MRPIILLTSLSLIPWCLVSLVTASNSQTTPFNLEPTIDFNQPESGEHLSGGAATTLKSVNQNSFSHSSANLSLKREFDFKIGNAIFRKLWAPAPASTRSSDGLGPLFNARSCQRCHFKDGRGHPPSANWPKDNAISMFLRLSIPPQTDKQRDLMAKRRIDVVPEPTYGGQLQDLAIPGHPAEGKVHIVYEELPVKLGGGDIASLRKPTYSITHLGYGPLHRDVMMSPRVAPAMIGLGLLEAVDEKSILALADEHDDDNNGISGRPNQVWSKEHNKVMLGRFGWKAGQPSVAQQNAGAFAGDIGISSKIFPAPAGDCTAAQGKCLSAPHGLSHGAQTEINETLRHLVDFYARNLAVPARRNVADKTVLKGKELFYSSGCTSCHNPKFITGNSGSISELKQQLIWPYTDMLLHDLGAGLADNRPESVANGQEWRTAPLWGIGLTKQVNGHTFFLHDGRARNLLEAILWHGGEAKDARDTVVEMSRAERAALLKFLESL